MVAVAGNIGKVAALRQTLRSDAGTMTQIAIQVRVSAESPSGTNEKDNSVESSTH